MPSTDLANKTVAITGGAGYLGTRLAERLADRNRVRVLDVRPPRECHGEFIPCDVTVPGDCTRALAGADVVFHGAGLFGNLPSMAEPQRYHATNLAGTLNVLEACATHAVERLVFDSTAFVYGTRVSSPVAEDAAARPASIYGATKLAGEALVRYYDRHRGVPSVVLRFCRVRDAAKADVITVLARRIRDGQPLDFADDGAPAFDFVDREDATEAAMLAAVSTARETTVNVSSGTMLSVREIAEALAEALGRPLPVVRSSQPPAAGLAAEYQFGPRRFVLDVARGANVIGWRPGKTMLEMVRETAAAVAGEAGGPR